LPTTERDLVKAVLQLENLQIIDAAQANEAIRKLMDEQPRQPILLTGRHLKPRILAESFTESLELGKRRSKRHAHQIIKPTKDQALAIMTEMGSASTIEIAKEISLRLGKKRLRGEPKGYLVNRVSKVLRVLKDEGELIHTGPIRGPGAKWAINGFKLSRPLKDIEKDKRKESREFHEYPHSKTIVEASQ